MHSMVIPLSSAVAADLAAIGVGLERQKVVGLRGNASR
jgi:hypothetical protein